MLKKTISILIFISLLSACGLRGGAGDKLTQVTVHNDSQGNVMQVTAQLTQDNAAKVLTSKSEAQENSGYFAAQEALYSNPNLDGKDFAIMFMAQGLAGNKTMPTNSNDVKIAEINGSVRKTEAWIGFGKFGLGAAAGTILGGKAIDGYVALGQAAGTALNLTGDGNNVDITQNDVDQRASDNSSINESGNLDQAKGIPLNDGDLAPVALGGVPPTEEEIQAQQGGDGCTCPIGYNIRPGTTDICSDGNGGEAPASCPVIE